jgi:hypothetical protein
MSATTTTTAGSATGQEGVNKGTQIVKVFLSAVVNRSNSLCWWGGLNNSTSE